MNKFTRKRVFEDIAIVFFLLLFFAVATCVDDAAAQDVAYCKHGQTGQIITIEANMACPFGYYRI